MMFIRMLSFCPSQENNKILNNWKKKAKGSTGYLRFIGKGSCVLTVFSVDVLQDVEDVELL